MKSITISNLHKVEYFSGNEIKEDEKLGREGKTDATSVF